jgi:multidrug efflux system outer membrane protein
MRNLATSCAVLALLTACDLSPDLVMPKLEMPAAFKQAEEAETVAAVEIAPVEDGRWKRLDEKAQIEEFAWWRMYEDTALNELVEQAMKENPSLEAALARVERARAVADNRAADLFPAISVGIGPERTRQSTAGQEPNLPPGAAPNTKPYTLYRAQGLVTYELDLFGRNRNRTEAARSDADAEAEAMRTARLSLQTELTQTYFRLIAEREEEALLKRTVETRTQTLRLMRQRLEAGASDSLSVSVAEVELANAETEYAALRDARTRTEHALATLVGVAPSALAINPKALAANPPRVPAGMPSSLLERRPDIQSAAAGIAAANARIGAARTGYFPEISLSMMGGVVSGELDELFKWSNRTWTIGPMLGTMLTQPIFEGGRLVAAKAEADANYRLAVAEYKSAVLEAFREVEDSLSGITAASARRAHAEKGHKAANRAYQAASQRFKVGYTSQLEYLDAERSRLAAARAQIRARAEQFIASAQLVRALGGSWQRPPAPEPLAAPITLPVEPVSETPAQAAPVIPVERLAPDETSATPEALPPAELPESGSAATPPLELPDLELKNPFADWDITLPELPSAEELPELPELPPRPEWMQ